MYLTRRQYEVLRTLSTVSVFSGVSYLTWAYPDGSNWNLIWTDDATSSQTLRSLCHLGLIGIRKRNSYAHGYVYTISPDGERLLELMPTWLSRRQQGLLRRLQGSYSAYKVANDGYTHSTTCSCRQCCCRLGYWYDTYLCSDYAAATIYALLDMGLAAQGTYDADMERVQLTDDGIELAALLNR